MIAALFVGTTGCGSTAPPTVPPTGAPPTAGSANAALAAGSAVACRNGTVSVSLGPDEGAAGTVHVPLRFTNTGARPCVIQGFARLFYVPGGGGRQLGREAQRDGSPGTPVTLAPGEVASAALALVQTGDYDRTVCRPTPTPGLRVYPPDDTTSVFVAREGTACAGTLPVPQLRVGAVKPGPGGR